MNRPALNADEHLRAADRFVRINGEVRQLLELIRDRDGIPEHVLETLLQVPEIVDQVRKELTAGKPGLAMIYRGHQ